MRTGTSALLAAALTCGLAACGTTSAGDAETSAAPSASVKASAPASAESEPAAEPAVAEQAWDTTWELPEATIAPALRDEFSAARLDGAVAAASRVVTEWMVNPAIQDSERYSTADFAGLTQMLTPDASTSFQRCLRGSFEAYYRKGRATQDTKCVNALAIYNTLEDGVLDGSYEPLEPLVVNPRVASIDVESDEHDWPAVRVVSEVDLHVSDDTGQEKLVTVRRDSTFNMTDVSSGEWQVYWWSGGVRSVEEHDPGA
jgi:hypothetical protein